VVYDKTVFKPEELGTLGRYKFLVVDTGPTAGQSDTSLSNEEAAAPPSQFDLGDFSNMKPAEEATGGQEDELPLLGGPEIEQ